MWTTQAVSLEGLRTVDVTEQVLRDLINSQVPEGKTIDYKRELPGPSDNAKKDFLRDLCSFANAAGGYLIYGMSEDDGLPVELEGLNGEIEQAVLRLQSMARDSIRPSISGLQFQRVPLENGNTAIVVVVPKSWNPPHQVTFQKDYSFYTRGSGGKEKLDVDELRHVVLQSHEVGQRIREFRTGRLASIIAGDTAVRLVSGACRILHFIPLTAFAMGATIDLSAISSRRGQLVSTMGEPGGQVRYNVDGLLACSRIHGEVYCYSQMYRNGIIEIVSHIMEDRRNDVTIFGSITFEREIINITAATLQTLRLSGASSPLVLMLSFTGIKGWTLGARGNHGYGPRGFDRDPLVIPELMIHALETDDVPRLVRPVVDATWNAAGYPSSENYDEEGVWKPGLR